MDNNGSFEDIIANTLTPKAAISYLRVSTHGQAERGGGASEGFSIPAQREANKKKAASIGAIIIKEFVDRGASARSADRPELQRMLEYISENRENIDYVIVHKIDRLARNRGDDVDITRSLQKAGVKLISTTESIDETPAGMLLHGIMSSIAEFYSRNLSNEVIKGLSQKAKNGGTNYRAPLGYINVRDFDEMGRENRYVDIDEERAPLISLAFKNYATGDWTIKALADYLASRGLTTKATPKIPSKPVNKGILNKILVNPYYKGYVYFQGALYQGKHEPLTDERTWEKVQGVLASHYNGERTREHPHFLKSTVYCGSCGSRLLVHNAKSKTGVIYPYFVCAGRHSKRVSCKQKAVLIDEVESQIEKIYQKVSISSETRKYLETLLREEVKKSSDRFKADQSRLLSEKEKLERQQAKLLQAHYEDAIPLNLLKSEQERIAKALIGIENEITAQNTQYEIIEENLGMVFDLIEDCGQTYKHAPESIKRAFNQAIFEKILVYPDETIEPEYSEPFALILDMINSKFKYQIETSLKTTKNPDQNIFFDQGLSNVILVEIRGLEPLTF